MKRIKEIQERENASLQECLKTTEFLAQLNYEKLQAENARMKEALEWYADEGNYLSDESGCVIATAWERNMLGYKARKALKSLDDGSAG